MSGHMSEKKAEVSSKDSTSEDMELEVQTDQTDSLFTKIRNTLSELESGFDDIDRLLEPLLSQPLSELASNLGPIDRARLYLLYGYALNSLISLFLELKGQDSKIKILEEQYRRIQDCSEKITNTVNPPQPSLSLNRDAASRFIKSALSNVKDRDRDRDRDRDTRENGRATSSGTHIRFNDDDDYGGVRSKNKFDFPRDDRDRDNRSHSLRHGREYRPYDRRDRDRDIDGGDERKSLRRGRTRAKENNRRQADRLDRSDL